MVLQYKSSFTSALTPQEDGYFSGYASVFGLRDEGGDVVVPGAFAQATSAFAQGAFRPHLLWQHHMDQVMGRITALSEDATGLKMEAQLLLTLPKAQEAYTLMKEGLVSGLSIGFVPILTTKATPTAPRHLVHVKLYEVSVVTHPANPQAWVTHVKSNAC